MVASQSRSPTRLACTASTTGADYATVSYFVNWHAPTVHLTVFGGEGRVGEQYTIQAQTSENVGPTPLYTEIYDNTMHQLLGSCGTGTACNVNVSQPRATTHSYIAYVASTVSASYFPPANFATYSQLYGQAGNHPTVNTSSSPSMSGRPPTNSLTSPQQRIRDVGSTPYYIEIFSFGENEYGVPRSVSLIARCGSGTKCSAHYYFRSNYVAFVSASPSGTSLRHLIHESIRTSATPNLDRADTAAVSPRGSRSTASAHCSPGSSQEVDEA